MNGNKAMKATMLNIVVLPAKGKWGVWTCASLTRLLDSGPTLFCMALIEKAEQPATKSYKFSGNKSLPLT